MAELPSIELGLYDELADPEFRQKFFVAEASSEIARQLVRLRTYRGLSQQELAEKLETKQPAISRVESANYRGWSFSNLLKIAQAQDARLRVLIEPWEDVRDEYRDPVDATRDEPSGPSVLEALAPAMNQYNFEERDYGIGKPRLLQNHPAGSPEPSQRAAVSPAGGGGARQSLQVSEGASLL